jgi:hypothetical protein
MFFFNYSIPFSFASFIAHLDKTNRTSFDLLKMSHSWFLVSMLIAVVAGRGICFDFFALFNVWNI